jgi:hypothetical protein
MARMLTAVMLAGLVALAALAAPPLARVTYACSCAQPTPTVGQAFKDADAVFSGRPRLVEQTKIEALFPDPRTQMVAMVDGIHAQFEVIEIWKGVSGRDVDLWTGRGGGDCGFDFHPAEAYLVFARRTPNGRLVTGDCTNTMPLADAVVEIAALGPGTRIQSALPETPPFALWPALIAAGVLTPISLGALWLVAGPRRRRSS